MPTTLGLVPHPAFDDRIIANSTAWDDNGPRSIVGTCVHRMVGTLWGTDGYFRGEASATALTDYGIGGQLDGTDDGTIFRWNDPHGIRTPYANGWGSESPGFERNGQAFYQYYGSASGPLASIELSGLVDTPVTAKQLEALAQLIAHLHDGAGVPSTLLPVHPGSNLVTALEHFEFVLKECPYTIVRALRDRYLARAEELMAFYQSGDAALAVPFIGGDGITVVDGPANLRASASPTAAIVTTVAAGSRLGVSGQGTAADGSLWYRVTPRRSTTVGWIAANLVGELIPGGAPFVWPTAIAGGSTPLAGDLYAVADGPLNLRSAAGTSSPIVASLSTGTKTMIVGGPASASGYTWYQVDTRMGRGWAALPFLAKAASPVNRLANSTAETNLANISPSLAGNVLVRALVNDTYAVRCTNPGLASGEGVRYASGSLALTGPRFFSGVVDVAGGGLIDAVKVRVMYADGSASTYSAPNPDVTLSHGAWKRAVTPIVASDPAKTVSRIELWVRRQAAVRQSFLADNARVIEL